MSNQLSTNNTKYPDAMYSKYLVYLGYLKVTPIPKGGSSNSPISQSNLRKNTGLILSLENIRIEMWIGNGPWCGPFKSYRKYDIATRLFTALLWSLLIIRFFVRNNVNHWNVLVGSILTIAGQHIVIRSATVAECPCCVLSSEKRHSKLKLHWTSNTSWFKQCQSSETASDFATITYL